MFIARFHQLDRIAFGVATILIAAISLPAAAQLQIPNPLIRPRSITNPGSADSHLPPAPDNQAQRSTVPPPPSYPGAGGSAGGTLLPMEDSYARDLNELKERFSSFYVSAIVGKQAVLRRSAAARTGAGTTAAQPIGSSMAPLPLAGGVNGVQSRNDSLMLADGEMLDAIGNSGQLVAKVDSRQVTIYHVQEAMALPGIKTSGRHAIVFIGMLEASGAAAPVAIVLQIQDPAYKRSISVDTRIRSASAGQDSNSSSAPTQSAPLQ